MEDTIDITPLINTMSRIVENMLWKSKSHILSQIETSNRSDLVYGQRWAVATSVNAIVASIGVTSYFIRHYCDAHVNVEEEKTRVAARISDLVKNHIAGWAPRFRSHIPIRMLRDSGQIRRMIKELIPEFFTSEEIDLFLEYYKITRQMAIVLAVLRIMSANN